MRYRLPPIAPTYTIPVLLPLLLLCAGAVHGQTSPGDPFELEGEGWKAVLTPGESFVNLESGGCEVRIHPLNAAGEQVGGLAAFQLTQTNPESTTLSIEFRAAEESWQASFRFEPMGTVCITPGEGAAGVRLAGAIDVGVLPGKRLEDVLYFPESHPDSDLLYLPNEGWFAGLLKGEGGILAAAWPEGSASVKLHLGGEGEERRIAAVDVSFEGKELYLELLTAPGIWHREQLQLEDLAKDVASEWKRPFPATYKTQLPLRAETQTPRTFTVAGSRHNKWMPEVGSFTWPVWFHDDRLHFYLSKRIPPKGAAVFFPMENGDKTIMGFLHRTPLAKAFEARSAGRGLPGTPKDAVNVGYNACAGTWLLRRTLYVKGVQNREREFLAEHTDYLVCYVARIQARNKAYEGFMDHIEDTLRGWREEQPAPEILGYLGLMEEQLSTLREGHERKMALFGGKTPEDHNTRADQNAARLKELLQTPGPELYAECFELVDQFNRMSWGHSEDTGMRFNMLAREWALAAATECASLPEALPYAVTVRNALRDVLNGALGY